MLPGCVIAGAAGVPFAGLCSRARAWLASRPGGVACATFALACASALQCLCLPSEERTPERGGGGCRLANRERRGAQAARVGELCEPESKVTAPCGHPVADDVSSPSLGSTKPWPPSTERSRAKAAGRSRPRDVERDGNPRRPATHSSPSDATATQTASQPRSAGAAGMPVAHETRPPGRSGYCDCTQDDDGWRARLGAYAPLVGNRKGLASPRIALIH